MAYPKKVGKLKPDINRDSLHELMQTFGWEGVSLIALDDSWAVMRFRPPGDVKQRK